MYRRDAPNPEIVMDSLAGWEVVRKQAPSTPTASDVEDGVKDLAQGVYPGPSADLWSGKVRL